LQIIIKNILVFFIIVFLSSCQTNRKDNSNLISQLFNNDSQKTDIKQPFWKTLLDKNFSNVMEDEPLNILVNKPKFKKFSQKNSKYNLRSAVNYHPSVRSALSNVKASKLAINTVESGKKTQISFQALGGITRDNSSNTAGAVGSINLSKLLYDFGAIDYTVLSQKEKYQLSKVQAEIQAETIALRAYEILINLNRQNKILEVYDRGLSLAEPILGQIKNISLSGLSDKAMILKAQQDYSKLVVSNTRSVAEKKAAKALFLEIFPGGDVNSVEDLKTRNVLLGKNAINQMLKKSAVIKAQDLLISSLMNDYKTLKAQKKANVTMNAGISAPAEDTIDESTGNVGILVNYVFNDGGRLDSQIEAFKAKIKEAKQQKLTIQNELESQLNVAIETYIGAKETYMATLDLVNLSTDVRDTSKDQLVSGRSKIQDVLNAEVTLAENIIQQINAEAELKISSYRIRALTHGLTNEIGWKAY